MKLDLLSFHLPAIVSSHCRAACRPSRLLDSFHSIIPRPLFMDLGSLRVIFFLMLLFLFVNPSPPTLASELTLPSDSEVVSLGVYYESLCPYSANFIVNYVVDIFQGDLLSIIELNLVPWSNPKIGANDTFYFQHGPSECLLNTVEACALNIWPELSDHFPLIYCIEELVYEHNFTQWESCFKQLGLNVTALSDCYTSGHGKELELKYASETDALQPPHQYVPWVVVNGEPLYDDYENFVSYVCKAYSGTSLPEACSNSSVNPTSLTSMKKANEVCHRREATTTKVILPRVKPFLESIIGWM